MMMKSDYERWHNDELYMYDGYGFGWDFSKPVKNELYTKDEVLKFIKNNTYYKDIEDDEITYESIRDCGFISCDDEGSEYLESYYKEFTTPSGETIVAFGEYGYDG
jgi:hypothetical protein